MSWGVEGGVEVGGVYVWGWWGMSVCEYVVCVCVCVCV